MQQDDDRQPNQHEEQRKVHADEDWKKSVAEEKQKLREQEERHKDEGAAEEERPQEFPEPSIQVFLAGLYTQTLVALGALENPMTRKREQNVAEAAYLIDTIDMLSKKTQGNLTPEEGAYTERILYDLRMRYVSATREEESEEQDAAPAQGN